MRPAMARKSPRFPQPDGPAIVRPEHVRDRQISHVAGAPRGYSNLSMIEQCYYKRQLEAGSDRFTPEMRRDAGVEYGGYYLFANGGGTADSLSRLNAIRSSGGYQHPQSQEDAICLLGEIKTKMGARDGLIVKKVCGQGHTPPKAIKEICGPGYKFTTSARLSEAMDALIEALAIAKRIHRRLGLLTNL